MLQCCCSSPVDGEHLVSIDTTQEERYSSISARFKALLYQVDAFPDEEEPFKFVATLHKGSCSSFNLGVGTGNSGELIIMGVKEGPGTKWNKSNPELELRPFDCILEVNGVSGVPEALIEQLSSSAVANLLIRRPREFAVSICKHRKSGRMLGLGLSSLDNGTSLSVHEVSEGGLVQQWNREQPTLQVLRGHRVVQVNGIAGDSNAMLELIGTADDLALVLQRH